MTSSGWKYRNKEKFRRYPYRFDTSALEQTYARFNGSTHLGWSGAAGTIDSGTWSAFTAVVWFRTTSSITSGQYFFSFTAPTGENFSFLRRQQATYAQSVGAQYNMESSVPVWIINTPSPVTNDSGLNCFMLSGSTAAGLTLYMNDTLVTSAAWDQGVGAVPIAANLFESSAVASNVGGGSAVVGDLGLVYLRNARYDFSVESNRRLFITEKGYPVMPPSNGYLWFGSQQTIANWNTGNNQGSGIDYTVTGTITQGDSGHF